MVLHYHMYTSISIDKITRDRAAKRAESEHLPLAVVVRILLTDYAEGNIGIGTRTSRDIVAENIPVDQKTQAKMDAVVKQWRGRMKA